MGLEGAVYCGGMAVSCAGYILARAWWLGRGFPAGRVGPERAERTNHQICAVSSAVPGAIER